MRKKKVRVGPTRRCHSSREITLFLISSAGGSCPRTPDSKILRWTLGRKLLTLQPNIHHQPTFTTGTTPAPGLRVQSRPPRQVCQSTPGAFVQTRWSMFGRRRPGTAIHVLNSHSPDPGGTVPDLRIINLNLHCLVISPAGAVTHALWRHVLPHGCGPPDDRDGVSRHPFRCHHGYALELEPRCG